MKKLSLFLLVCVGFVFLSACFQGSSFVETSTPSVESSSIVIADNTLVQVKPNVLETTSITDDFDFRMFAMHHISLIKDKYFYVYFKDIIYQPISNNMCVIFDFQDEDYERATYYMIGREKGSLLTAQQLSYVVSNETGSHGGCFTFMNKEATYEILIGKIDRDDLNPSTHIEAVAVVEFTDPHYDDRHKIGTSTLTFDPSIDYTYDTIPSKSFDFMIEDTYHIIQSVKVALFADDSNTLLDTSTITLDQLRWQNNKLVIDNYIINDLAPYVNYRVKVYIDGFNGFEQFSDILVQNQRFTSQNITYSKGYRQHGFFAEVICITPGETSATMQYIAVNDLHSISITDQLPYYFKLTIYNSEDHLIFETILDVTQQALTIPNPYAEVGNTIKIITDREDIVLHHSTIEEPSPDLRFNPIVNRQFSGIVTEGLDKINGIVLFIYLEPESNPIDEFEIISFSDQGEFTIVLPDSRYYRIRDEVLVMYQINYGPTDDPLFFTRQVWVKIQ